MMASRRVPKNTACSDASGVTELTGLTAEAFEFGAAADFKGAKIDPYAYENFVRIAKSFTR